MSEAAPFLIMTLVIIRLNKTNSEIIFGVKIREEEDAFDSPPQHEPHSRSLMFLSSVICQSPTLITNTILEFNTCTVSCSSGKRKNKRNEKELDLRWRSCTKLLQDAEEQPADSQIRSYRERRCSRRTRGPPPASLLSSQSPSSPQRRSLEGEGGERKQRRRRG